MGTNYQTVLVPPVISLHALLESTGHSTASPSSATPILTGPEDKYLRLTREQEKTEKKSGLTGFRPQRNKRNRILSLGGNLDFPDKDRGGDEY